MTKRKRFRCLLRVAKPSTHHGIFSFDWPDGTTTFVCGDCLRWLVAKYIGLDPVQDAKDRAKGVEAS